MLELPNELLNFVSLSRYSLIHFYLLSHMAVYYLHHHQSHLLLFLHSFIPGLRLGSSTVAFFHTYQTDSTGYLSI